MSAADRPEPPEVADERATLTGFLDYQRATLAWKISDLGTDGRPERDMDRQRSLAAHPYDRGVRPP